MSEDKRYILLVEDDEGHSELVTRAFETQADGLELIVVRTLKEARAKVAESAPALVLLDLFLPDGSGIEFLSVDGESPRYPIIIISSHGNERQAVEAMKAGALDYVVKSEEVLSDMPHIVNRSLREWGHITERRRAEGDLKKLSLAVEQSPASVVITDTNGTIEYVNPRFSQVAGYSREEAIGQNPRILKSGEQPVEFYREMWNTIKSGHVWRGEFHNKKKSGELYWEAVSISPIKHSNGTVTNFVAVKEEITARKRMEDELVKLDRLDSLGVLAGGLAHDFNNLLTAILGNISLAMSHLKGEDEVVKRLTEAEKASFRARDLTYQLLTFARGGTPVTKLASIGELIEESTGFALRGSNVRYDFAAYGELWPVNVDEGQIGQVIHNIVINANHAMPEGGVVSVRCENISMQGDEAIKLKEGEYVKISIEDHGIGISKKYLLKIFDPYFTTKQMDSNKGSGLGLATAYSIIKKHDGYITVNSTVGVGTTFTIYLPAYPEELTEEREKEVAVPLQGGTGRILIMDDEEVVREVAGEILASLGYCVDFAGNGSEAIALYREAKDRGQPYELIIMDLTIPGGMGGEKAIEKLRAIDHDVKAIVSSGYSSDPIMANFTEYGFSGVLTKPYKISEMSKLVKEIIES
ncbi:MAG: response regulator [Thermodesulfobacteriota bacterium]